MIQLHVCHSCSSHHFKELSLCKVGITFEHCCVCAKAAVAIRSWGLTWAHQTKSRLHVAAWSLQSCGDSVQRVDTL